VHVRGVIWIVGDRIALRDGFHGAGAVQTLQSGGLVSAVEDSISVHDGLGGSCYQWKLSCAADAAVGRLCERGGPQRGAEGQPGGGGRPAAGLPHRVHLQGGVSRV
jgi:hypothetical protein